MDAHYTPIDWGLHDERQLLALRRRDVTLRVVGDEVDGRPFRR